MQINAKVRLQAAKSPVTAALAPFEDFFKHTGLNSADFEEATLSIDGTRWNAPRKGVTYDPKSSAIAEKAAQKSLGIITRKLGTPKVRSAMSTKIWTWQIPGLGAFELNQFGAIGAEAGSKPTADVTALKKALKALDSSATFDASQKGYFVAKGKLLTSDGTPGSKPLDWKKLDSVGKALGFEWDGWDEDGNACWMY